MATPDNLAYKVIIATSISLIISITSVLLRLISRRIKQAQLLADDYFDILALILMITLGLASLFCIPIRKSKVNYAALLTVICAVIYVGLGQKMEQISPQTLQTYRQLYYAVSIIFIPAVALPKLSVLFFYRRILPVKQILLSTTIISYFLGTWCVANLCMTIFRCSPVSKTWDTAAEGSCINPDSYALSLQLPSIVLDVTIIVVPLKPVWNCALKFSQKLTASAFFLAGLLPLAGDIARMTVMIKANANIDITYSQVDDIVWTNLAPALAIVACSIPVLRPIFQSTKWLTSQRSSRVTTVFPFDIERCNSVAAAEAVPTGSIESRDFAVPKDPPKAYKKPCHISTE